MTDTQEYPWIKHYPEGVPATINPDIYESLPDFQEKICQEYGDAPVFTSLGKTMTYKEFDEKVTAFASYLQSLPGVEQGDRVAVMSAGHILQLGTPEDIYNEPKNAFVADFIGDSNIVDGVMHRDFLVSFSGVDFPCVDRGFAREESVQVVVRPEDIEVVSPVEGQLVGVVNDVIFKGVHFEMHVECEGREWLIHSTRACTPGETIGMRIGPNEIHIMSRSEG